MLFQLSIDKAYSSSENNPTRVLNPCGVGVNFFAKIQGLCFYLYGCQGLRPLPTYFFCGLLYFLFAFAGLAQQYKPKFQVLAVEQGLSQNVVTAVQTDAQGFLWIGTQKGLNRYDGYEMKHYFATPDQPTSLPADVIHCLYKTSKGQLWVGTSKGLCRYNPVTDDFERFAPKIQSNDFQVFTMLEDQNNQLWLGTQNGIYRFSADFRVFENYKLSQGNAMKVEALFEDSKGNLWAGSTQGLAKFDRKAYRLLIAVPNISVKTIAEDHEGNLWAGCTSGLHTINLADASTKTQQSYLANNPINALVVDSQNILWIATNWGLFRLDKQQNKLDLYSKTNHTLQSNYVNCLYKDDKQNLWIGTYSGLHFTSPYFRPIQHIRYEPMQAEGISNDTITCLLQDNKGKVWVGTANGLNVYDSLANEFIRYFQQADLPHGLIDNQVQALYQDKQNKIWIATQQALTCFDTEKREFEHFLTKESIYQIVGKQKDKTLPQITALAEDAEGNFWLGTQRGEILRWDKEKKQAKKLYFQALQSYMQEESLPKIQFLIYQQPYMWVGTLGAGLFRLHTTNGAMQQVFQFANNTDQNQQGATPPVAKPLAVKFPLSSKQLWTACLDEQQKLWIGTNNGLNLLNTNTLQVEKVYTEKDGLAGNQIKGVLKVGQQVWVSTEMGISRLDTKQQTIKNFTVKDGLQGYDFNPSVALKTKQQTVYFGGNNGLNYFSLASMQENRELPTTKLINFYCLNLTSRLDTQIVVKKYLELQPNQNSLYFEFAALNFVSPEDNAYAYKLEGFDKDWHFVGKRRFANYTNLPAGNYKFKVKAANNDGYWNSQPTEIQFVIKAPFWQKLWFWIFVLFAGFTGLYTFVQLRIRQQRAIRKELQRQVTLRTQELVEQKKQIELINQNLESVVQERTKTLTATIAENEKNLQALQDTNLELDTFTYHASHDLKAPLSSVLGLIQIAKLETQPALTGTYLTMMEQSIRKLDGLVADLLALSRNKRTELISENIDWLQETNDCLAQLQYMDNFSQIVINKNFQCETPFHSDSKRIRILLNNLISNAIKYQKLPYEPYPTIDISIKTDDEKAVIEIKDNGEGIHPDFQAKIFSMFYRATNKASGSGLGLYITKSVAEKLGGSIQLHSVWQHGTTVVVVLPNWELKAME